MTIALRPSPSWLRFLSLSVVVALVTGCASVEQAAPPEPQPVAQPEPVVAPVVVEAPAPVAVDLWERIRQGFVMPELQAPLVAQHEKAYTRSRDALARMTARSEPYLFHIVEEIEKRGMPTELALLPFVESAFNPQAVSVAKAAGMWQFIPSTGRSFDLKQNIFRDDRRNVLASTRAALDYLSQLHGMFDDWHLALAAYNWGEGSVRRAINANRKAGRPTDFMSLRMPRETRNYVPKLLALKNIINQPDTYQVALPAIANHPFFDTVPVERDMDVDVAIRLAEVSEDLFRRLNPQMNKPVILAAGTEHLLLPFDNAERFRANLANHPGPWASWTAWVAPSTLTPAQAAELVNMDEAALREVNRIPARVKIKEGSTLLVARAHDQQADVSAHVADSGTMALSPEYAVRSTAKGKRKAGVRLASAHRGKPVRATARARAGVKLAMR